MVFKHNEQTLAINELDPLAYEPWRELEIDGELATFPELSPLRSDKLAIDGRQENFVNSHLEIVPVGSSYGVQGGNINEIVLSEHNKRPLDDDEDRPLARKRPKQLEANVQLGSPVLAYNYQGSSSDAKTTYMDPDFLTSSFPFYFDEGCLRAGDMYQPRESSSTFVDDYPRKLVAIGPNHQAVIPEWRFNEYKNCHGNTEDFNTVSTSSSPNDVKADEDDSGKMTGTRIMPMPDTTLILDTGILQQKMDCSCPDVRSFRCVRQHITEVREKLEKAIGHDRFVELGFCDMGECVAEKWTGEEEQLFQEVVLSNPASLGKNFWDYLPRAFPSRSSKEFVSYYFNVFMLRKRAEQNRFDPLNIDSDNDEWQESDDGRYAAEEDEEDSAVESPADEEDVSSEKDDEECAVDEETEYDKSEEYVMFKDNEGRVSTTSACARNSAQNYVDEQEVQDDSCTSFDAELSGVDFSGGFLDNAVNQHGFTEGYKNLPRNDGFSAIDHGFLEVHCGPKVWDICFPCGEQKDELLSTHSVIEEVFGKEGWKSSPINSHGFSHF